MLVGALKELALSLVAGLVMLVVVLVFVLAMLLVPVVLVASVPYLLYWWWRNHTPSGTIGYCSHGWLVAKRAHGTSCDGCVFSGSGCTRSSHACYGVIWVSEKRLTEEVAAACVPCVRGVTEKSQQEMSTKGDMSTKVDK